MDFYRKLISYSISTSSDNIECSTTLLGSIYDPQNPAAGQSKILNVLKQIFSNDGHFQLNCGGRIDLTGEYKLKIKSYKKEGRLITVVDGEKKININLNDLYNSIGLSKTKVRFYGMIELLYISQYGHLFHLPSYCKVSEKPTIETKNQFFEFISPMSNNDLSRSMERSLDPLAYSLIDLDFDSFKYGLEILIGDKVFQDEALNDWVDLYRDYPRSNEKASADQNPAIKHFERKVKMFKKKLHEADLSILSNLKSAPYSFYTAREIFAESFAFYHNIIEAIHVSEKFKDALETFLKSNEENFINYQLNSLRELFSLVLDKLKEEGLSSSIYDKLNFELEEISRLVNAQDISIYNYQQRKDIFLKVMSFIRKIGLQYYKFVAFIISTVFKSNLFLLSAVYSKEEISNITTKKIIERITPFLTHNPNFISEL